MGTKSFFKNQTGLPADSKAAVKDNLINSLADAESSFHIEERAEEQAYLLPDIDYSDLSTHVRYGLAYDYYNNAFKRIRTQYPYDGSAGEKTAFYNDLTPFERYILDNDYPRYNGYVTVGTGSQYGSATPLHFGTTTVPQYIRFYGGPHENNIIDSDVKQENNLHLSLSDGFSVEFWYKKRDWAKPGADAPPAKTDFETEYESLLNIRNEEDSQRFYLFLSGSKPSRVYFYQENWQGGAWDTINSGAFELNPTVANIADQSWRHLGFTFKKLTDARVKSTAYVNGQSVTESVYTVAAGSPVYTITGSVVGTIGGAGGVKMTDAINVSGIDSAAGNGKPVSSSFDEFRIWKTERTGKQIGLNWFRPVNGGTNTDSSKYYYKADVESKEVDLAVYFKFNEGIISDTGAGDHEKGSEVTSSTAVGDNLIVDYSGRISNGVFVGYDTTLLMRSTDSAMVLSSASVSEKKDPLLFKENPNYSLALDPLLTSGSNYDVSNLTSLYNNIPQWIRDDDDTSGGQIKKLLQAIGSYFDTLHAQIEHVKNFREAKYISSANKTTDYAAKLLKASGFNVPSLFVDPDVLSAIVDQDEKRIFEDKLYNLKNKVYKNIYTNLIAILKSKGTENSFRNLFRCYGTDDELFKINLYADDVEYQVDDKTYDSLVRKRVVDFSGLTTASDRELVVHQESLDGAPDDYGYYSASNDMNIPMTVEAQIIFPKKPNIPSLASLETLMTASLFGVHSSSADDLSTYVPLHDSGDCDFHVYTWRNSAGFAKFALKSTAARAFFPTLTSDYFVDEEKIIYDGVPWNLAVRIYPKEYPFSSVVSQSETFILNFYGVKTHLGETLAEFDVSEEITRASASQFLTGSNKTFFVGAEYTNITESLINKSDVKFARFMVWNSYLTNEEITKHSRNPRNYGLLYPYQHAFPYETSDFSSSFTLKADTLALNWEFDDYEIGGHSVLYYYDSTSGSQKAVDAHPTHEFGGTNSKNHRAKLSPATTFDDDNELKDYATRWNYLQSSNIHRPDSLYGKNMTRVLDSDYNPYQKNKKPVKLFFAFEASQNEVLSRDMLNFFADVVSFNNLYGEPVHAYRDRYKQLEHFKRFYFSRIETVDNLDKFVNLYKFLDNALDSVLKNLIPASAATSDKIRTIIEDHVSDRHKVKRHYNLLTQRIADDVDDIDVTGEFVGNEGDNTQDGDGQNSDNINEVNPPVT